MEVETTPKLCCPDNSDMEVLASNNELPNDVLAGIVALLPQKQR